MSGGQTYLLPAKDMDKVSGPLSVVKGLHPKSTPYYFGLPIFFWVTHIYIYTHTYIIYKPILTTHRL